MQRLAEVRQGNRGLLPLGFVRGSMKRCDLQNCVNVNTTYVITGATALLLPAQDTHCVCGIAAYEGAVEKGQLITTHAIANAIPGHNQSRAHVNQTKHTNLRVRAEMTFSQNSASTDPFAK